MNNKSLKTLIGVLLVGAVTGIPAPAFAASDVMMNLLSILRDKGSISQDEYNALVAASQGEDEDAKKEADKQKEELAKLASSGGDWTSKIKLKGDMRTRYQYQDKTGTINRDRGRIRYRLGIIATPVDNMEVGAGFASGSSDPRSTNQTFDTAFSTKGLGLDYAYIQYKFTDYFTGVAGKFGQKGYLYKATDLMWDDDINPEGFSGAFNFNDGFGKAFLNGGIWVMDEASSSKQDPYMGFVQLGQTFGSGDLFGTVAGTWYGFGNINATNFAALQAAASGSGNTDYHFSVINVGGEFGSKNLFGNGLTGSLFGEYVNNTDTSSSQDAGFAVGAKLTNGTWTLKYIYGDLDANAVPDILPDSDRYDGKTNMRAHEIIAEYSVFKNVTLGLDYYNADQKKSSITQNILQADVVVKF